MAKLIKLQVGINTIYKKENSVKGRYGWQTELKKLINQHNQQHSTRHKVVGVETQKDREVVLFNAFKQLRTLGFKIEHPKNLQERHFKALLQLWLDENLSASTLQKRTSIIRTLVGWLGKDNMIKPLEDYVEDKSRVRRDQVARVDKSWSSNGVSYEDKLAQMMDYDIRLGAQMMMIKAYGLRRAEAVMFRPIVAMRLGVESTSIVIEFGTKGGRPRSLAINNDEKRVALEFAVSVAKKGIGHIGWEELTLKQAIRKYANAMIKFKITKKDLGVTGHGLRHEYLNDTYEAIAGQPSPVRGGLKENVDPELDRLAREITTQEAGHSRLGVTASYFGSHQPAKK